MRKLAALFTLTSAVFLLAAIFFAYPAVASTDIKTVGITQIVEHPALEDVRTGVLSALSEAGYVEGKNLKVLYENAQGNLATSAQIATKLLSSKVDVGVAISTPSAQTLLFAAQKQGIKIPIVFAAVSDPQAAKLNRQMAYPITGVTDAPQLEGLLELILKMIPQIKSIGLLYNPAEANSVATITEFTKLLSGQGIRTHEVMVNKTGDVAQAVQSLMGKVDALYFPQDNTVVSAIETVVNVTQHAATKLPTFSSDPLLVKRGILAAVGFDYHDLGKEAGQLVVKILKGENAANLPIRRPSSLKAVVNQSVAQQLGVSLNNPITLQGIEIELLTPASRL